MAKTVADLTPGEKGRIMRYSNEVIAARLLEMGLLPGSEIMVLRAAPFGCPLYLKSAGRLLALRRTEAQTIELEL